jgi:hypothetical protein
VHEQLLQFTDALNFAALGLQAALAAARHMSMRGTSSNNSNNNSSCSALLDGGLSPATGGATAATGATSECLVQQQLWELQERVGLKVQVS